MDTIHQKKKRIQMARMIAWAVLLIALAISAMGCNRNIVYQRSVSELNQKGIILLQQGKPEAAIARFESAYDLMPQEPSILYNLAIAYRASDNLDKSIETFEMLIEEFPNSEEYDKSLQSLGVVLEEKADKLVNKAIETKGQGQTESDVPYREAAVQYYDRALIVFESYRQTLEGEEAESVAKHLEQLEERLEKVKSGNLEELRVY